MNVAGDLLQAGSCEEFSGGRWTSIKQNNAWDFTFCDPNIQLKYFKWKKSVGLQSSVHCGLKRISSGSKKFIKQMLQDTAIWGRKKNNMMKLLLSQIPRTVFIKVNRNCTCGSRSRHSPSTVLKHKPWGKSKGLNSMMAKSQQLLMLFTNTKTCKSQVCAKPQVCHLRRTEILHQFLCREVQEKTHRQCQAEGEVWHFLP